MALLSSRTVKIWFSPKRALIRTHSLSILFSYHVIAIISQTDDALLAAPLRSPAVITCYICRNYVISCLSLSSLLLLLMLWLFGSVSRSSGFSHHHQRIALSPSVAAMSMITWSLLPCSCRMKSVHRAMQHRMIKRFHAVQRHTVTSQIRWSISNCISMTHTLPHRISLQFTA